MHMAALTTQLLGCGMKETSQRESSRWAQQVLPQQPVRSSQITIVESSLQINWMLKIQPELLDEAYWQQHQESLTQADQQVASYLLFALAVVTLPQLSVPHAKAFLTLLVAWSCALAWQLLLLRRAKLYSRYRLWILTVLRLSMTCVALQCASSLQAQLRSAQQPQDTSRAFLLIMQLLLVTNTVHIPMVAIRLKMPMVLQLVLTALQPLAMLWMILQDLVACASSHGLIQGVLRVAIECWGSLLESGKFMPVADSSRLQGRSSAMLVVLCTLYSTTVTLTLYVCYMRLWGDQLRWLQETVATAAASTSNSSGGAGQGDPPSLALNVAASGAGNAGAAEGSSEGETVGYCSVDVHALCLRHRRQLQRMCSTPAARLLFNRTGIRGKLSVACIQASVVNVLCLGCLLVSQEFAQKLLPRVIPHSLDCCYPRLPAT